MNTKYYANNPVAKRDFKQTFFWADEDNQKITQLSEFAEVFLEDVFVPDRDVLGGVNQGWQVAMDS